MRKLEGIITVTGILLIIGLPMFLLVTGTDTTKSNLDGERLISINSYSEEKAVVRQIDIDSYEEDFDVLDGSKARDAIEIIDNLTPLASPSAVLEVPKDAWETIAVTSNDEKEIVLENETESKIFNDFEEEIILEDAVPEWIGSFEIENEETAYVNANNDLIVFTDDAEEDEGNVVILSDVDVPESLELFENPNIKEEVIIEFNGEDVSETYDNSTQISDEELAAYDSTEEEIVFIDSEVLPQGLDGINMISFECSELNDGYGSRIANISYLDENGNIKYSSFAY